MSMEGWGADIQKNELAFTFNELKKGWLRRYSLPPAIIFHVSQSYILLRLG